MDMDRINSWVTLGANIGILIGLVLVGYEIRQNSALVRAQLVAAMFSDQKALAIAQMGEDYPRVLARSVEEPGSMTLEDIAVVQSALEAQLIEFRRNAAMEEIGVYTGRWRQDISYLSLPFTTPIGRKFWDFHYDDNIDWMRDVQAAIENTEPTWDREYLRELQKSVIPDQSR